jgi:hypothetical protein
MRAFIITVALGVGFGVAGLGTPAALAGGDKAKTQPEIKTVEGKLQALDVQKGRLTIKTGQQQGVMIRLTKDSKVRIDGRPGKLDDLKVGDVLTVTYEIRQDGNVAQRVVLNRPR